jgi:hypothetical protein
MLPAFERPSYGPKQRQRATRHPLRDVNLRAVPRAVGHRLGAVRPAARRVRAANRAPAPPAGSSSMLQLSDNGTATQAERHDRPIDRLLSFPPSPVAAAGPLPPRAGAPTTRARPRWYNLEAAVHCDNRTCAGSSTHSHSSCVRAATIGKLNSGRAIRGQADCLERWLASV